MADQRPRYAEPLTGLVHEQNATFTTNDTDELVDENGESVVIPDPGTKFEIQIPGKIWNIKKAVHENLCIAAAANSSLFNKNGSWSGKTLTQLTKDQYELVRGVFWNDDPRCLIFKDDASDNRNFGWGVEFGTEFLKAKNGLTDDNNLTSRSHFGNLQFLHAMGSAVGEDPHESYRKIKAYMFAMLSLYRGNEPGMQPDSLVKSAGPLAEFFNDSNGHSSTTFKSLLMGNTKAYGNPDICLRGLGSALHVIQDSFARGHCRRDTDGTGLIQNFHCYRGQNSDEHGKWDSKGADKIDPRDLDCFNGMYGARAAITRCIQFLDLASQQESTDFDKFEAWFSSAFGLHPNASGSNTST